MIPRSARTRDAALGLGLLVVLAARWAGLGVLPILDPSESRYALIAQTMAESGDWVTPRFADGTPFWGKPPLHLWLTALSFRLLGEGEFAARLPSALGELALIFLAYTVARRLYDRCTGLVAALVLASSLLGIVCATTCLPDMTLAVCGSAAAASFLFAVQATDVRRARHWGLAFFAALGLGLLAKGPVAVALAALTVGLWSLSTRDLSWVRRLPWALGTLVCLAIAMPWYLLAEARTPGFLQYFLLHENLLRYLTRSYGDLYGSAHERPPGFIWGLLVVALLPWSALAPLAIARRRREGLGLDPTERFLLAWGLSAPLFFTATRSVLMTYLLPSLPGLCVWLARVTLPWLESERGLDATRPLPVALGRGLRAAVYGVPLASAAAVTAFVPASGLVDPLDLAVCLAILTALPLTLGPVARRSALGAALALPLAVATLDLSGRVLFADEVGLRLSMRDLVSRLDADGLERCESFFWGSVPYSAQFYGGRRFSSLDRDEARLSSRLAGEGCHVLVLRPKDIRRLRGETLAGLREVYARGRYRAWTDLESARTPQAAATTGAPNRRGVG